MARFDCEKIILGCTELSLMQEYVGENEYPVIDAQSILADQTIARALQHRQATISS